MLTLHQLTIHHQDTGEVFRDLSLSLYDGAMLVVRGANGSGKTSLLRAVAGLKPLQHGEVLWDGVPVQQHPHFQRELVYLGHKNALKTSLTVEENLHFWAHMYGGDVLLPMAVHWWGLKPVLDDVVGILSQGWQRRGAVARLMLCPGRLWVLDEPISNLDLAGKVMFERLIESRRAQGGIVILSSHVQVEIPRIIELEMEDFKLESPYAMEFA